MIGTQLVEGTILSNRYVVKGKLGQGGMATVYAAFDPKLNVDVALKVLPVRLAVEPGFVQRFRAEGQTLAQLNHPNILRLFDLHDEEASGLYYLVLEYLSGGTLKQRVKEGEPWDVATVVEILRPVALALDYAHQRRRPIVHRDLKPANIMFGENDQPIVSDFGLARMLAYRRPGSGEEDQGPPTLASGELLATPQYMAPEEAEGHLAGPAGDLYSLGVIAYQILVGRVPFSAETPQATLIQVARDPLPLPIRLNPDLEPPVGRVLLKGLARDPSNRYGSAKEFVDALEAAGQLTVTRPATYELDVVGSPVGAEVIVDGKPAGRLPCAIGGLLVGTHVVRVEAFGHRSTETRVAVPANTSLEVTLVPELPGRGISGEGAGSATGEWPQRPARDGISARLGGSSSEAIPQAGAVLHRLEVRGSPAGAKVFVDESLVGELPGAAVDLPEGSHTILVKHDGFVAHEQRVGLTNRAWVDIDLSRRPDPSGSLMHNAKLFQLMGGTNFTPNSDEVIHLEAPVNLLRGVEWVGGWLWLTNQRLAFRSHHWNFRIGEESWPLTSISAVLLVRKGFAPKVLEVQLTGGRSQYFGVPKPAEWQEALSHDRGSTEGGDSGQSRLPAAGSNPTGGLRLSGLAISLMLLAAGVLLASLLLVIVHLLQARDGLVDSDTSLSQATIPADSRVPTLEDRSGFEISDERLSLHARWLKVATDLASEADPERVIFVAEEFLLENPGYGLAIDLLHEAVLTHADILLAKGEGGKALCEIDLSNQWVSWAPTEPDGSAASLPSLGVSTTVSTVNLRSTCSGRAPVRRVLPAGAQLDRLEDQVLSEGQNWRQVRTDDGLIGWVLASSIR